MNPFVSATLYPTIDLLNPFYNFLDAGYLVNDRQSRPEYSFVNGSLQDKDKASEDHFTLWPGAVDLKL